MILFSYESIEKITTNDKCRKKTDDIRVYVIIIRVHGFYVKCSQIYFENKNEKIVS